MEAHPPKPGVSGPAKDLDSILSSIPMDEGMKKRLAYDAKLMENCRGRRTQESTKKVATPTPVPASPPKKATAETTKKSPEKSPEKPPEKPKSPVNPWLKKPQEREKEKKRTKEEYELIETIYGDYVCQGKIISPPDEISRVEEKTVSVVVFSLKSRKMAQVAKDTFEDALKTLNFPTKNYTRRGFATWDLLMNSKEEAEKVWSGDWHTKTLRLHPEYMGRRKAQVTVHNVPLNISADHLEVFFNQYGEVRDVKPVVGKTVTDTGTT